jgi:peptidoglycan/xylan/chitin deacetylase (PgdA/CDA1 family)
MAAISSIIKTIKLLVLENIYTQKVNINLNKAIISFTFDDVPISAATNGAAVLEKQGLTGTYYVALGMEKIDESSDDSARKLLNANDIKQLQDIGHDIGCHTYSHLNQRHHAVKKVLEDCNKNTAYLQDILNTKAVYNFAYPFGMVSPLGKRALGKKYKTLRTTDRGINSGLTDMSHLRAVRLYSKTFDKVALTQIINLAIREKAWLIFYTHDVCEQPSEWGVTTDDFEWVVKQCVQKECEVLNINDAYNKITYTTS